MNNRMIATKKQIKDKYNNGFLFPYMDWSLTFLDVFYKHPLPSKQAVL
jgi:hypothetical protein